MVAIMRIALISTIKNHFSTVFMVIFFLLFFLFFVLILFSFFNFLNRVEHSKRMPLSTKGSFKENV